MAEKKQTISYTQAIAELEAILKALENSEETNLDTIGEQVKRATVLMEFCRKQLHEIDEELKKMVEGL